jgi:transposase
LERVLEEWMGQVIIGMDPHKRSATIEVMAGDEAVLGGGRYVTDLAGYRAMLAYAKRFRQRTWAIEGCQGIGRHIANRLLADSEQVVDVPPKLSARARCSRPARAVRPMRPMPIRSRWSAPG